MPEINITIDLFNFLKLPWYYQVIIVLLEAWFLFTMAAFLTWILSLFFPWAVHHRD